MKMTQYSIESLLIGKAYQSPNHPEKFGVINDAVKRDEIWVGSDSTAYAIRYRNPNGGFDKWSTISVKFND